MTKRDIPAWLPLGLLVGALLALFHRLLTGEALFWGLPSLQFYPWRHYAFQEIIDGRLPAWNPYVGAGAPMLANYQTAVFYPPNWVWLVLPDPLAMNLIALVHVIWAGVGMWLFTGSLGLTQFGRGVSTLAYALGGYLIARMGSFPTADAGAWIPWIFWLTHRIFTRRRLCDSGWLALALGLQLLAGHAQTAWYSCVGVGFYALWFTFWGLRAESRRAWLVSLLLFGTGMVLGVAGAAVQLVPTAELLSESDRSGGLDFDTTANLSYNPFRLVTLLSPNFYGTPADGSYLTEGIYFEDAAYIGFVPFVSAIAAIVGWRRKRRALDDHPAFQTVPFWALLALGALLIATGRYGPVFRLLYDHVPTFDAFREPVRWLVLSVFSLAVLAGIGVQHWRRGKWVVFWSRLAAAGGGGTVLVALVSRQFMDLDSDTLDVLTLGLIVLGCWIVGAALFTLIQPQPDQQWLADPVVWRAAVLVFITVDLAWAASGLNPTVPVEFYDSDPARVDVPQTGRVYWFEDYEELVKFGPDEDDAANPEEAESEESTFEGYFNLADYRIAAEDWRVTRGSLLPNLNMLDRVTALNNFDPLLVGYPSEYIDLIEDLGDGSTQLLRAAGVTTVYGMAPDGWRDQTPLFEPTPTYAYAWLVPEAEWHDSDDAIKAALRDPGWNPAQTVILAGESPIGDQVPPASGGAVEILKAHPKTRRFRVETDGAAYLVVANSWYPGWEATVNGQKATLYRANLAFQAVSVPPGGAEVLLRYEPTGWQAGAGISLLAVLAVAILITWDRLARESKKLRRQPSPPEQIE